MLARAAERGEEGEGEEAEGGVRGILGLRSKTCGDAGEDEDVDVDDESKYVLSIVLSTSLCVYVCVSIGRVWGVGGVVGIFLAREKNGESKGGGSVGSV